MKITTRKGLYVSSSFTEKFGNKDITPATTVPGLKTLERNMYDSDIKKELGPEQCLLEDVAAFLTNPPEGTNDGNWNIFYVARYVVNVSWDADRREWYVLAWGLDGDCWRAGRRVFSRNWHSDTKTTTTDSTQTNTGTDLSTLTLRIEALEAWRERVQQH